MKASSKIQFLECFANTGLCRVED